MGFYLVFMCRVFLRHNSILIFHFIYPSQYRMKVNHKKQVKFSMAYDINLVAL